MFTLQPSSHARSGAIFLVPWRTSAFERSPLFIKSFHDSAAVLRLHIWFPLSPIAPTMLGHGLQEETSQRQQPESHGLSLRDSAAPEISVGSRGASWSRPAAGKSASAWHRGPAPDPGDAPLAGPAPGPRGDRPPGRRDSDCQRASPKVS